LYAQVTVVQSQHRGSDHIREGISIGNGVEVDDICPLYVTQYAWALAKQEVTQSSWQCACCDKMLDYVVNPLWYWLWLHKVVWYEAKTIGQRYAFLLADGEINLARYHVHVVDRDSAFSVRDYMTLGAFGQLRLLIGVELILENKRLIRWIFGFSSSSQTAQAVYVFCQLFF
jgi:hypothetical protein